VVLKQFTAAHLTVQS